MKRARVKQTAGRKAKAVRPGSAVDPRPDDRVPIPTLESVALELARSAVGKQAAGSKASVSARPPPGKLQAIPDLAPADTQRLFRLALARACGGDAAAEKRGIVWRDGDDELLLYIGQARLATTERLVVTALPIFTDQTGYAEIVVPFGTNAPDDPVGLIAATETRPRGPAAVIDIFGEALVAVMWAALVNVAVTWAAAAGSRMDGVALAPAGLAATKSALRVSAQVPFDREKR